MLSFPRNMVNYLIEAFYSISQGFGRWNRPYPTIKLCFVIWMESSMISFARTTTLIFMQGRAKPLSPPITDRGGGGYVLISCHCASRRAWKRIGETWMRNVEWTSEGSFHEGSENPWNRRPSRFSFIPSIADICSKIWSKHWQIPARRRSSLQNFSTKRNLTDASLNW